MNIVLCRGVKIVA